MKMSSDSWETVFCRFCLFIPPRRHGGLSRVLTENLLGDGRRHACQPGAHIRGTGHRVGQGDGTELLFFERSTVSGKIVQREGLATIAEIIEELRKTKWAGVVFVEADSGGKLHRQHHIAAI